jgi:integrase
MSDATEKLNKRVDEMTDRVIAQERPKEVKYEIVCRLRRGLRCVVRPNGRKLIIHRFTRPNGKANSKKLAEWTPGSGALATALEAYRADRDALINRRDPSKGAVEKPDVAGALRDYVAQFLKSKVNAMRLGTQLNVRPVLGDLCKALGDRPAIQVKRSELMVLVNEAATRGPHAMHKVHCVLHQFFAWLTTQVDDYLNPMAGTTAALPEVKSRDRVLDDQELAELLYATKDPFVWLLALTGARRCEISDLARSEIRDKALVIHGSRTKTGKTFNIAITPAVRRVLTAAPNGGKYVCNGLDVPFSGFSKLKKRLPALSRSWTYHDLRRTFSTRLAALGVKQEVIDACTGHKAGTIQQTYNRYGYSDEMREAWELWAKHIDKLVKQKGPMRAVAQQSLRGSLDRG